MMKQKLEVWVLMAVSTGMIFWRINEPFVWLTDELLYEEASYRMAGCTNQVTNTPSSPEARSPLNRGDNTPLPTKSEDPLSRGELIRCWLVPSLSDVKVWLEKPPLYLWLTAPLFWIQNWLTPLDQMMQGGVFGFPWIRRFWSAMAGVGTVYVTYLIAKKWFGHKTGLLAASLLLATPLFLSSTKTASVDLVAGFWGATGIYYYLRSREDLASSSAKDRSRLLPIWCGLSMGLTAMTRSWLGLIPGLAIMIDQLILNIKYKKLKIHIKNQIWTNFIWITVAIVITLPWHVYVYFKYGKYFVDNYFGFSVLEHGVRLTPGYAETEPWFYGLALLEGNVWLLPILITAGVGWVFVKLGIVKKSQFKVTRTESVPQIPESSSGQALKRVQDDNKTYLKFLLIWILVPFVILSLAKTRHEWYIIQVLPAVAIVMAVVARWTYQVIACPNCAVVKYLSQIIFAALVLVSILAVLTTGDPSAESVKALRWMTKQTTPDEVVYSYKRGYLPMTELYQPREVQVVREEELETLNNQSGVYIFVSELDKEEFPENTQSWEAVREFGNGTVFRSGS